MQAAPPPFKVAVVLLGVLWVPPALCSAPSFSVTLLRLGVSLHDVNHPDLKHKPRSHKGPLINGPIPTPGINKCHVMLRVCFGSLLL